MCINWRGKDKGSEAESSAGGKTKKTESGKRKARRKLGDRALRWVKAKQKQ